jgi:Rad3-related DNA helicase
MYDNKIYYPLKFEPRKEQIEALNFIKNNIRKGKKYMMLNLPTGTGKSFLNIMFINWYLNYINDKAKFDILTNSKILQNQYTKEFSFIASLKGKNSYVCDTYNCSCLEGKEMNKALKRKCSNCPYDAAINAWLSARISLTNFHLFNTFHLYLPSIINSKNSNVLIVDEADMYENIFCDFISVKISQRSLKLLGFDEASIMSIYNDIKFIKSVQQYVKFIKNKYIFCLELLKENLEEKLCNPNLQDFEKIRISKYITNINSTFETFSSLLKDVDDNEENLNNWSLDINDEKDNKLFPKSFIIQPIWSYKYLEKTIWNNYDHVIFMSGTILDRNIFSFLNGLDNKLTCYHEIQSPFKLKNRPIYYLKGIGKMTFENKIETWINQKKYIYKIINKYKNVKGIIHTSTYEIANWVKEEFEKNDRFIFHTSDNKGEALLKHIKSDKPTIIVSPSMMTGIDLKDELSRFQIVVKIPYPSLNSNKIKQRIKENKDWYGFYTCSCLIQMYGRSIRNYEDWCNTFILDDSFSNILKYNYNYLPQYFTDAIKYLKK